MIKLRYNGETLNYCNRCKVWENTLSRSCWICGEKTIKPLSPNYQSPPSSTYGTGTYIDQMSTETINGTVI